MKALFTNPKELQKAIDSYFVEDGKKTISGLAYHLGFESRQSFYDYEENEDYSYTIKRARLRVEMVYEEALHSNSCTGAIFALKNLGWKDKSEVEQSGTTTQISVTVDSSGTSEELKKLIDGSALD